MSDYNKNIVFTGRGKIAECYTSSYDAKICSFRFLQEPEMIRIIKSTTCLIHNSANVENHDFLKSLNDNFILTKKIIDLCVKHNPEIRFVYLSSMSILDLNGKYKKMTEMEPYGLSKYLSEIYCLESGLKNIVSVRFSTLFYKDKSKDALSKFIYYAATRNQISLINNGKDKRDFLPIEIAVDYLQKLIISDFSKPIINICSGSETPISDIIRVIKEIIPDVLITNQYLEQSKPYISKFNTEDIDSLGRIEFSLANSIKEFLEKCKY